MEQTTSEVLAQKTCPECNDEPGADLHSCPYLAAQGDEQTLCMCGDICTVICQKTR